MFCSNINDSVYERMLDYDELSAKTNWSYDYLFDVSTLIWTLP